MLAKLTEVVSESADGLNLLSRFFDAAGNDRQPGPTAVLFWGVVLRPSNTVKTLRMPSTTKTMILVGSHLKLFMESIGKLAAVIMTTRTPFCVGSHYNALYTIYRSPANHLICRFLLPSLIQKIVVALASTTNYPLRDPK